MRPLLLGTAFMQDDRSDSCETIVSRISGQDYIVFQTLVIGMWNRFLTGFDSPAELFVNLRKEHVDYDDELGEYQANANDDFYWTSMDKQDVDYTIEYDETDNKGHLTPNPAPYTPEEVIPEPLRF